MLDQRTNYHCEHRITICGQSTEQTSSTVQRTSVRPFNSMVFVHSLSVRAHHEVRVRLQGPFESLFTPMVPQSAFTREIVRVQRNKR